MFGQTLFTQCESQSHPRLSLLQRQSLIPALVVCTELERLEGKGSWKLSFLPAKYKALILITTANKELYSRRFYLSLQHAQNVSSPLQSIHHYPGSSV